MRRHLGGLWRTARRTRHAQAVVGVCAARLCGDVAGTASALTVGRRCCCTAARGLGNGDGCLPPGGSHAEAHTAVEPEVITLDAIEVEVMSTDTVTEAHFTEVTVTSMGATDSTSHDPSSPHPQQPQEPHASSNAHPAKAAATPVSYAALPEAASPPSPPRGAYTDVSGIDVFARSHVVNFVRRMGHSAATVFHVRELAADEARAVRDGGADGRPIFAATCRVPLPEPHTLRVAEGFAEDAKEAEVLAAMHAERVCDALGVQLFRIKAAQQKHADAVRREEGRYAPYPGDPVMPAGTPAPPPLRFLRSRAAPTPAPPSAKAAAKATPAASASAHADCTPATPPPTPTATSSSPPPPSPSVLRTGEGASGGASVASPSGPGEPAHVPRIVLRRHEPQLDYARLVPHYTDAEHAARVQGYASTVVYPWDTMWDTTLVSPALSSSASRNDNSNSGAGAGASALMPVPHYEPSECGLWAMVNDRNCRCSPTPEEALVLPFVYDGPHAERRVRDYYTQHGTTLEKQLRTRLVPAAPGSPQRFTEAELRLVGVTVVAKGRAPTKEVAVRLAAMHAELLLDTLGHALFPSDPQRQARHATVVHGYGRWAMNPVTGDTTSPNPHDALPAPMKLQIGGDDAWMGPEARQQFGEYWSESQHIVNAAGMLNVHAEETMEVQPPPELLDEACTMLRDWQVDIAKNRFPHLFVLTDLEKEYRAVTITPVPATFGVRGGVATARTHEDAVRLCALHAMDSLCVLGIPLCVDARREREYLQRRAALGMVLPHSLAEDADGVGQHSIWAAGMDPRQLRSATEGRATGPRQTMSGSQQRLPMYAWEGSQIRPLPRVPDFLATRGLRLPHDFCLFGDSSTDDAALLEVGTSTRTAVSNYLQSRYEAEVRQNNTRFAAVDTAYGKPAAAPSEPVASSALPRAAGTRDSCAAAPTTTAATATTSSAAGADMMAGTLAWAHKLAAYATPCCTSTGMSTLSSVHNLCFLPIPLPDPPEQPAAAWVDASGVAAPPSQLAGPVYAIAVGLSLKRKDAERACFVHAASVLHSFGVDVLRDYRRGLPRTGAIGCFADVARHLGQEPLTVVSPYLPDGTLRPESPEAAQMPEPAPAPAGSSASVAAAEPPGSSSHSSGSPAAAAAGPPSPPTEVRHHPPGSLHPPRPAMHCYMKYHMESVRGISVPRRRKPNARGGKW